MEKTILILTHVNQDNSPYCSFVHSHAKALVELGYNVIVVATIGWVPFIKYIKKSINYTKFKGNQKIDGVNIYYVRKFTLSTFLMNNKINFNGLFYYYAVKRLVNKLIKKHDIKYIDAHTFRTEGYVAYKLKKKYKIPTVITIHGTSFMKAYENGYGKKEMIKFGKIIDSYVCVSEKLEKYFIEMGIKNVKVIYNGIYHFPVKRNNNNFNIVTISSFLERKRISYIISAFSIISEKYPQSTLTIVGDGKLKKELNNQVKKLNLDNKIIFTGQIDNKQVYKILANSKIFVLISVDEGFGIVYPESMYAGCIPIATKHEGIDGFIVNNYNGFLINSSVDELTAKIEHILENECIEIRENAIESAKKLTWKNNAQKYLDIIEKL